MRLPVQVFYTDGFVLPLPDGHRFPMARYRLLRERIVADGTINSEQLHIPPAATNDELLLVHTSDYVQRVVAGELTADEIRRIGFPWSPEMVERSRRSVGATIAATLSALETGLGINLAGGTHHAYVDRGAGYCVFNDVAVAVRVHQQAGRLQRVMIIDVDVHQGDGTAAVFQDNPQVITTSLHARKAFPVRKQTSDLDISLDPGTGDEEYLTRLGELLELAAAQADIDCVYVLAGADPYEHDTLGGLSVTQAGLAERDRRVFQLCREQRWPVVLVMAGGYAEQIADIVSIQAMTIRLACEYLQSQ